MTEKELSQLRLLDDISIRELEQRLEFEAWSPGNWCGPIEDAGCPVLDAGCPIIILPPSG